LPKAELPLARKGRLVMSGTPEGRLYARRHGVRFALVDPTCGDLSGHPDRLAPRGRPLFVSKRLVVLRLAASPRVRAGLVGPAPGEHHRQSVGY
jgi:hypothetical protein